MNLTVMGKTQIFYQFFKKLYLSSWFYGCICLCGHAVYLDISRNGNIITAEPLSHLVRFCIFTDGEFVWGGQLRWIVIHIQNTDANWSLRSHGLVICSESKQVRKRIDKRTWAGKIVQPKLMLHLFFLNSRFPL